MLFYRPGYIRNGGKDFLLYFASDYIARIPLSCYILFERYMFFESFIVMKMRRLYQCIHCYRRKEMDHES